MIEAVEKLDKLKEIWKKFAEDESSSLERREKFAEELKELNDPKSYKALQKMIVDNVTDDLNRFSNHFEGLWTPGNNAPSSKPAHYHFFFPPLGPNQSNFISGLEAEFWRFAAYAPKEQSKTLIKAILNKRALEMLDETKRGLTSGKFVFNEFIPERSVEIIQTLLTQLNNPAEVAKLVDWRVKLLIKGLDTGEKFNKWFSTTFAANVFPKADEWLAEPLRGQPIFDLGGGMTAILTVGGAGSPAADFFCAMIPCTAEDFSEAAMRKFDIDEM